jgi:NhaA family Na+:H+ antiporter
MRRISRFPRRALHSLLESESGSGIVLIVAAALALVIANSPLAPEYFGALDAHPGPLSVLHWVNDALMALFFLLIGLEIKREFVGGELATWPSRILPGVAALGGMIVPALIFVALNRDDPQSLRGWAVPTATDIAFALGVLSLLGPRVPASLKIFLTALAIIDDLGAITIIAALYTGNLQLLWLGIAAAVLLVLWGLNRTGVTSLAIYLLLGTVLWFGMFRSGIHPTLAGVMLALTIPIRSEHAVSPLHKLEDALQPWVGFLIVPLFGFANAGVALTSTGTSVAPHLSLGIIAGLFLGKPIGVFGFAWASIKLGFAARPEGSSWSQLFGVSILCGIGFTMSLFIGLLAFPDFVDLQSGVKLGVLIGSACSAVAGALIILVGPKASPRLS